jgi:hypothetical protein
LANATNEEFVYAEPTTVTSPGVSFVSFASRLPGSGSSRKFSSASLVMRIFVHGRVEVEPDPVALEHGGDGFESRPFGHGDRRPRVDPVDDAVAAEPGQVARRGAEVDAPERDAGGQPRDGLRAHEPRRLLAEAEQVAGVVGGDQEPRLVAEDGSEDRSQAVLGATVVVLEAVAAAECDERDEQRRDGGETKARTSVRKRMA